MVEQQKLVKKVIKHLNNEYAEIVEGHRQAILKVDEFKKKRVEAREFRNKIYALRNREDLSESELALVNSVDITLSKLVSVDITPKEEVVETPTDDNEEEDL